jgi:hypothetical protein
MFKKSPSCQPFALKANRMVVWSRYIGIART